MTLHLMLVCAFAGMVLIVVAAACVPAPRRTQDTPPAPRVPDPQRVIE